MQATESATLLAYHNDPELKEKFVKEMKWHREKDMILQGAVGEMVDEGWRGCHVACGVHSMSRILGKEYHCYSHSLWPELIGIPEWLAYVCEGIFEGLPEDEAKEFPVQFSEAVGCGKNLDLIRPAFSIFVLESIRENAREDGKAAIDQVIALWRREGSGEDVPEADWSAARSAARSAAWSAARSAAWSAARSAAESAAESAARSAAWSAARSAAESAAESAAWIKFRDHLLRLVAS